MKKAVIGSYVAAAVALVIAVFSTLTFDHQLRVERVNRSLDVEALGTQLSAVRLACQAEMAAVENEFRDQVAKHTHASDHTHPRPVSGPTPVFR